MNRLQGFERLFDLPWLPPVTKAIQLGYFFEGTNQNALKTNQAYRNAYNRIVAKHYTNAEKMRMLQAILNNANKNKNATRLALKSVDKNMLARNANYANLYNKVANKLGQNAPVRMRKQQGGTCWFHAIINGLLMSPRPRRLLRTMVAGVSPMNLSGEVCPPRRAKREWFLKYIKHRLETTGPVHNAFRNESVIRSTGLRGLGRPTTARYSISSIANRVAPGVFGGSLGDLVWFYNHMFPGQFTNRDGKSTPLFVMKKFGSLLGHANPAVPHELMRNGVRYELTHGWMNYLTGLVSGHAITGYKTPGGEYRAYDSAFGTTIPGYDWTKAAAVSNAPKVWEAHKLRTGGVVVYAIYMRVTQT